MLTVSPETPPQPRLIHDFIPIADLPPAGQVGWDMELPDLGPRQLVLNPGRLASLTRLGGFDRMTVMELVNRPIPAAPEDEEPPAKTKGPPSRFNYPWWPSRTAAERCVAGRRYQTLPVAGLHSHGDSS